LNSQRAPLAGAKEVSGCGVLWCVVCPFFIVAMWWYYGVANILVSVWARYAVVIWRDKCSGGFEILCGGPSFRLNVEEL